MKDFILSVVIPVYNEEHTIDALLDRLLPILKPYQYELIFVDDGSNDATASQIKKYAKENKQIKLLSFNRNFGHQMALVAGYSVSRGEAVISLDADLQDPPEIIPEMVEKWQDGAEIVYAKRNNREVDDFFKRKTAEWFYSLVNYLTDNQVPQNVGDYRLLDRKVVNFLKALPEHSPFLRGLVSWSGFSEAYVHFSREKRHGGKTHYTIPKMINFALDGITSFSTRPLRLASYMGFLAATFGFLGVIYAIVGRIFLPTHWVTGWTALFVGIMFHGGVQLIAIGIIGEYISKIFHEVQNRPHYLVKEKVNL